MYVKEVDMNKMAFDVIKGVLNNRGSNRISDYHDIQYAHKTLKARYVNNDIEITDGQEMAIVRKGSNGIRVAADNTTFGGKPLGLLVNALFYWATCGVFGYVAAESVAVEEA